MKISAGLLAVCIPLFAASAANAQSTPPSGAPAYYVAHFAVTDLEGIKPYSAAVESSFRPFGGRFIVRGAEALALEGASPRGRTVVIKFDTLEKAKAWYDSPEYSKLRPIRQRSGDSVTYILQGLPD